MSVFFIPEFKLNQLSCSYSVIDRVFRDIEESICFFVNKFKFYTNLLIILSWVIAILVKQQSSGIQVQS
ncbi:hypothetical protein CDG60_18030 [Acinetobacter chinensis]|uniref:Uncharacterized protein n=1 Tax=Acinetobacter chinensis TaxID=2004650 RepID=A0A3B7M287_9GAMM|nr:hypothetical protein CDG60_18030 [Acinetobacter chinensis]